MPVFIDLGLFWRPPGEARNREKMLGGTRVVLPFQLQKRFCCEVGLEDAILDDSGLQNVNFGFQKLKFWKRFRIIFHLFWGSTLAAVLQIARHNVSCTAHTQHSKLARNLTRTCQNLSKTLTPAAERLEPKGGGGTPPRGASIKLVLWSGFWLG